MSRYAWAAGQYPHWDEEFVFHNISSSFNGELKIEFCNADKKGRICNTLGHVCISLADLLQMRRFSGDLKFVDSLMEETPCMELGLRGNRGNPLRLGDRGIISVDIKVTGDYKNGEKELLEALNLMGFETSYGKLKQAGFASLLDLYSVCVLSPIIAPTIVLMFQELI